MTDNNYMAVFDQARVLYRKYGTVRGNSTEFAYFKKTHRDWRDVLPLLEPAIQGQIKQRARDGRYWKNFKTWIYNRCWEEEYPVRTYGESPEKMAERKKARARDQNTKWLTDPRVSQEERDIRVQWAKAHGLSWLVDEIKAKEQK